MRGLIRVITWNVSETRRWAVLVKEESLPSLSLFNRQNQTWGTGSDPVSQNRTKSWRWTSAHVLATNFLSLLVSPSSSCCRSSSSKSEERKERKLYSLFLLLFFILNRFCYFCLKKCKEEKKCLDMKVNVGRALFETPVCSPVKKTKQDCAQNVLAIMRNTSNNSGLVGDSSLSRRKIYFLPETKELLVMWSCFHGQSVCQFSS